MKKIVLAALGLIVAVVSADAQQFSADELTRRTIERRAVEAANWGIPVVNFDRMVQATLAAKGAFNQIVYWSGFAGWNNQTLTPNPDTIYLKPFFDTKDAGPMVLEIPPAGDDGSITGIIMDCWQAALEDVGPAGVDKGKGGKYLINRDTLHSAAVLDLDAGPATITLPDAGKRFMSMQIVNEDQYSLPAIYKPRNHVLTKEKVGTRYVIAGVRTLVDPNDPADIGRIHHLQDGLKVEQKNSGKFEIPKWDPVSRKVRDGLIVLGTTLTDTSLAFGTKDEVDPVQRLVSAATTWDGNPRKDAIYLNFTAAQNDGSPVYKLNVKDVPVEGFSSMAMAVT